MTKKINININHIAALFVASFALIISAFIIAPERTDAQVNGCSALPSTKGLAVHTENNVPAGNYTIFARVKLGAAFSPPSDTATFDLSIDGSGGKRCNHQVSKSVSSGNWAWYDSGNTKINWSSASNMRFQMSGDKDGVGLDCIVLVDEAGGAFNPSSKEDCAGPTGTTNPPIGCARYDVNNSGSVNTGDAGIVYNNRGQTGQNALDSYDVNDSGSINTGDAGIVYNNRGCTI